MTISADDVALVEKIEHREIKEAHVEEELLEEALEEEGTLEDLENLQEHEKKDPE